MVSRPGLKIGFIYLSQPYLQESAKIGSPGLIVRHELGLVNANAPIKKPAFTRAFEERVRRFTFGQFAQMA